MGRQPRRNRRTPAPFSPHPTTNAATTGEQTMATSKPFRSARTKTVATGVATILGTAAAWYTGALPLADGLQMAITALLAIFLREGIAKGPVPEK
jgi:hypothetical protein